jgi:hypothetical protein
MLAAFLILAMPVLAQESDDSTETVIEVHMSDSSVRVITENESREQIEVEDDDFDDTGSRSHSFYEDEDGRFYFDEDVVIESGERIRDAVVVLFGDLEVRGEVLGDVVVVMGDLTLVGEGTVSGDAVCLGGQVNSDSTSVFEGEVVSFPISALLTGKGWNVLTGDDVDPDAWVHYQHYEELQDRLTVFDLVLRLFGMIFVALLILIIFRKRVDKVTSTLRFRPWKSLLYGLLFLLGLIVLFIPVIITLVLLLAFLAIILSPIPPLMILVLVAFLISIATLIIGLVVVPGLMPLFAFSRFTFEKRGMNSFLSVFLWILMIWVLASMVEWVGGIPKAMAVLVEVSFYVFGIGAIMGSRMGKVYHAPGQVTLPVIDSPENATPPANEEPPPAEA